jgi:hypothetical protein
MGAAAVFETAAATPPTVISIVSFDIISFCAVHLNFSWWGVIVESESFKMGAYSESQP